MKLMAHNPGVSVMRRFVTGGWMMLAALGVVAMVANTSKGDKMNGPLEGKMKSIDGKDVNLADFKGKVVLFVNVASRCGYTSQYTGLQSIHEKHKDAGLVVIGVPANEFGSQEPGDDETIKKFCSSKYNVSFPMMSKVVVKGDGICTLYKHLTSKETNPKFGGDIGWNFEKFLIGRDGSIVGRFKSGVEPESDELVTAIKKELEKK
jgi:glutathione peroxidase